MKYNDYLKGHYDKFQNMIKNLETMIKQLKVDAMEFKEDGQLKKLIDPKNKPSYRKPIQIFIKS